ncbi:MAG TPA: right-handed parallel beta-helix repeat-containing protein [Phycisphaeraceae bacterium]
MLLGAASAAAAASLSDPYSKGGWTDLTPASNSRVIYVSSSLGNDSNAGTVNAPVKTLEEAYSRLRNGRGDQMLLRAGDQWVGTLKWGKSGTADQPIVLGTYGNGPRPKIIADGSGQALWSSRGTVNHVAIRGIAFLADAGAGKDQHAINGIRFVGQGQNILIEDCLVRGAKDNILLQAWSNNGTAQIKDVNVRRNIVIDAYSRNNSEGHSQGLFASGVQGLLIEGNLFDHNGWRSGLGERTIFNHNLYIQTDNGGVEVRDNLITRGASHGLQLRPGGTVARNTFWRNAIGLFANTADHTVVRNLVMESDDIDPNVKNLHRGWGIDLKRGNGSRYEFNILLDRHSISERAAMLTESEVSSHPNWKPVKIRSNLFRNWDDDGSLIVVHPHLAEEFDLIDNALVKGGWSANKYAKEVLGDPEARFNQLLKLARSRERAQWLRELAGNVIYMDAWEVLQGRKIASIEPALGPTGKLLGMVSAIPEPATLGMIGLGALLMLRRRGK